MFIMLVIFFFYIIVIVGRFIIFLRDVIGGLFVKRCFCDVFGVVNIVGLVRFDVFL